MRCIAEHVQAILVGSGWHPSLFRSEMEILCRKRPFRFGTRVMLADSNYDFFEDLKRSATLDECLSPFGLTTDITSLEAVIEGWINDKNLDFEKGKSIAVRWLRIEGGINGINGQKLAIFCGNVLKKNGWKIDLESPDVELMIILDGISEHIFWGERRISKHPREGWVQRVATERPFFKPISLDPRLARVALNLVIRDTGKIICDPMCGTGGVLLEGALLNQQMVGIDLDIEMVKGTKENINWLKKHNLDIKLQYVFHGNAINVNQLLDDKKIKINGAVFDPPYGKNAWKSERKKGLFLDVLKNIRKANGIDLGARLVCFLPIKPGIHGVNEPINGEINLGDYSTTQLKLEFNKMGWEIIGMHAIPVHGSLARMLIYANAI